MKTTAKTYTISSIASVPIYLILAIMFYPPLSNPLTFIDGMVVYIFPIALTLNAIFVTPSVIRKDLEGDQLKNFIKNLGFLSIVLIVLSYSLIHSAIFTGLYSSESWELFFIRCLILFYFMLLASTVIIINSYAYKHIRKTSTRETDVDQEAANMFWRIMNNFVLPYFHIALIIFSLYLIAVIVTIII